MVHDWKAHLLAGLHQQSSRNEFYVDSTCRGSVDLHLSPKKRSPSASDGSVRDDSYLTQGLFLRVLTS